LTLAAGFRGSDRVIAAPADTSCSKKGVLGWITTLHDGIKVTCTPMMHCWRCDERHFLGGDETPLVWVSVGDFYGHDGQARILAFSDNLN
jgi:hypothetical protein